MDSVTMRSEGMPFYKLVLRCAIFAVIFCVTSLLLIVLTSAIFYNTTNPTAKTQLAGLISLYLAVFLTSFVMTKINGERWLFGGLILGGMIFVLTLFFSIFVQESANPQSIAFRLIIIIISLASAFLARKRESKSPKFKMRNK